MAPRNSAWLQSCEQSCENTLRTSFTSLVGLLFLRIKNQKISHHHENGALPPPNRRIVIVGFLPDYNGHSRMAAKVWISPEDTMAIFIGLWLLWMARLISHGFVMFVDGTVEKWAMSGEVGLKQ